VKPLVSIVIPVYNAGIFLEDCINSVIGQTLQEIEVICVDDCSTDGSLAKLESYRQRDGRIRVIRKPVNEGPSAARNLGMEAASGKYLLFVDSDDFIDKELCQKAYSHAEENDAGMVIFDCVTTLKNAGPELNAKPESRLARLNPSDKNVLLGLGAFAWSKMIRTDRIISLGVRFPEGIYGPEDALVHWRLILEMDDVVLLPERLYYYRQHASSITQGRGWRLTDRILVYDQVREFLLSRSLYSDYREPFLEQQLGSFYGVYDRVDKPLKPDVMAMIQQRMTEEHWRFVAGKRLPRPVRDFLLSLQGKTAAKLRRSIWLLARWCYRLLRSAGQPSRSMPS
jgi:glycosyltransferase involved in cell wall biosynthesis